MMQHHRRLLGVVVGGVCALTLVSRVLATGVPISGFSPFVGLSLTDRFKDENESSFFTADTDNSLLGTQLGAGGTPYYDLALIDTGAAASLITSAADTAYNLQGAGFRGTQLQQIGGATGFLFATINDPLGMYVTGVQNRTGAAPLTFNPTAMVGQSSVSLLTLPPESDLPNIVGIPLIGQFATYIRNDQPQMFQSGGKTVRSPQIQFLPLGSGGQGITRRAPMTLDSANGFLTDPLYIFNFENILNGQPLTQNPSAPTVMAEPGALFLNVNANNAGNSLGNTQFFFDTGADVTVVSELNAVRLGFDPVLDTPEFTVAIVGSGGVTENVPGFFVDQLTIQAIGGSITATNVPVIVFDVTNPAHPGNIVEGIIGTNILSGRNLVIDPNPSTGGGGVGPSLYISDPVTTGHNWANAATSGTWNTAGNWNAAGTPDTLWIANARNISGSAQEAIVSANSTVWELNVSGGAGAATMTVRVSSGATLSTFSGTNIEAGGKLRLDGGTLDAHFVDIRGGTLTGTGTVTTGSGPIPGQVENHGGTIAPGNGVGTLTILGRLANALDSTLAFELGGPTAGTQYDQLVVNGAAAIDGTLSISLVNLGGGTFAPSVGNTFTLVTATGGVGGTFNNVLGPDGYNWRVNYNANNVQLAVGNPGDFNFDGTVDARDYVVWRNNALGPLNFAAWRSHFGVTYASGTGLDGNKGIPEPTSTLLLFAAACGGALCRKRR